MWKKRKDIEGVSESSIVGLKAVLFQREQEAKRFKVTGEARPRTRKKAKETVWTKQNKGLAERSRRDEEALRAEQKTAVDVEAKLQEKARLYEQFVSGGVAEDPEEGKFLVDFQQKSWSEPQAADNDEDGGEFYHEDIQREEDRKRWERNAQQEIVNDEAADLKKQKDLEVLDKVIAQTRQGRDKARVLKERRKQRAQERLEKIKEREEQMKKVKEMGEKGEKELIIQIEEEAEEERLARERLAREREERERREQERKERVEREAKEREEMQRKKREDEEKKRAEKQKKKEEFLAANPLFAPSYETTATTTTTPTPAPPRPVAARPAPVAPAAQAYPPVPAAAGYYPASGYHPQQAAAYPPHMAYPGYAAPPHMMAGYPPGAAQHQAAYPGQHHYNPMGPTAPSATTASSASSFSAAAAADNFLARLMSEQQQQGASQQHVQHYAQQQAQYNYPTYPPGGSYGPPGAYPPQQPQQGNYPPGAYPPDAAAAQQAQQQQYWEAYYRQQAQQQ